MNGYISKEKDLMVKIDTVNRIICESLITNINY